VTTALRKWFGPSSREIWRGVSEELGGKYSGGWGGAKVQVSHGEWTITLDSYTVPVGKTFMQFTRMRAPYVNPEGFRFTIYRRTIFSALGVWLGMQDITVGDARFDEDFVVKATHEDRARTLFASPALRALIAGQRSLHLTVKDDDGCFFGSFPDGVDELLFTVPGIIKDPERLKALYDLFAETLERLCAIGSAYERNPHVTL
jgi:hypothetical protein